MTKHIEDELNLPRLADALKQLQSDDTEDVDADEDIESNHPEPELTIDDYKNALEEMKTMRQEVANIEDFSDNEGKMEELQELAVDAHKTLLDAGMNVSHQQAEQFLNPAVQSLNIAMDIEKTKIERKLKLMKLAIDKSRLEIQQRKLELEEAKMEEKEEAEVVESNDTLMINRNKFLEMIKQAQESEKK